MTTKKAEPGHDAERQQFEQEVATFVSQQPAKPPAGAQQFPSGMTILWAITEALREGGLKDQIFAIWQRLKGESGGKPPEPA